VPLYPFLACEHDHTMCLTPVCDFNAVSISATRASCSLVSWRHRISIPLRLTKSFKVAQFVSWRRKLLIPLTFQEQMDNAARLPRAANMAHAHTSRLRSSQRGTVMQGQYKIGLSFVLVWVGSVCLCVAVRVYAKRPPSRSKRVL
jgi:hypothetical protein